MILQALTEHYEALAAQGKIARPGWADAKISFALCLGESGELERVASTKTEQTQGKKTVLAPQKLSLPAPVTRTAGVLSNFLWDNSSYILGVDAKGKPQRSLKCFEACKVLHHQVLDGVDSPGARALLAFLDRWDPAAAAEHPALKEDWEELTSGANLVFRYNGDYLHNPDIPMLRRLQEAAQGCVKLVTLAPEQPGAMEFIKAAGEMGIAVSVGHTAADYDTAKAAFEAGANHVTHTYNGMPGLHHREPSVIGAAYEVPGVLPELICDGVHIHGSVVRLTFGLFGGERMILISDSLRATGMPDGEYPFGGQMIELHGNRATILGHPETLAGSVTSLMGCLRQAVSFGIPLADAVRACTFNPARSIGIDGRTGSLDTGKEASIVLLDEKDLSVKAIIFKGQKV